jgi:hypothetical protein
MAALACGLFSNRLSRLIVRPVPKYRLNPQPPEWQYHQSHLLQTLQYGFTYSFDSK